MPDDLLQVPPIRTTLLDPSGGNTTAKEWYYFWSGTGDKLNQIVTQGTHADRPNAGDMPDGALYVESDRSVIYANEGGEWHYIAGTMWGTLSPDQRPADLGPNDAGLEFRSIDSSDANAPRTFVWSGAEWIETTLVMYGLHANRPAADAQTPPRTLYVETDRTEVIYQQQANAWHYLAGTMWGTLSPDQRPTDLGANDAGFTFRSTDSSDTYAPREFLWSGTVWIETTLVEYGLHANRPAANAQTPPRTIYVETDRNGVIYQQQANSWHFLAGTMWGTFSPDQRPTDLGANDAGFTFRTTDAPPRSFVWSGSAWIETTPPTSYWIAGTSGAIYYNGGNVGMGIANPGYKVAVNGNFGIVDGLGDDYAMYRDSSSGFLIINGTQGSYSGYRFYTNNLATLGLVLGNNGSVGIGMLPGAQLDLSTDSARKLSTTAWATGSDIRIKRNVRPLEGGIAIIDRLRPIEAEHNGLGGTTAGTRVVSLIAQEVEPILPGTVTWSKRKLRPDDENDTEMADFNPHEILFHLILAVQQLSAELRQWKQRLGT